MANKGKAGDKKDAQRAQDEAFMAGLVAFTAKSMETGTPVPFGALIVETATGKPLMQALNAVAAENDPSSHAEVRTVRKAAKKLKTRSLVGYTMYSTCEPCPMCMANALWAGLDRVVFGATIKDANKHCGQIHIPAKEVSRRSDMPCEVVGKVLRDECYALFIHPNMLKVFASWKTGNRKLEKEGKA
jgi:tRNA(Arg) A34 adenosine deaminase TadA